MHIHLLAFALPLSVEGPMSPGAEDEREERPALVPSLFPFVAPTLYFSTADEKGEARLLRQRLEKCPHSRVEVCVDVSLSAFASLCPQWNCCPPSNGDS